MTQIGIEIFRWRPSAHPDRMPWERSPFDRVRRHRTCGLLVVAWAIAVGVGLAVFPGCVVAHESRPAHLEITETAPRQFDLVWRTPLLSGTPLPVALRLEESIGTPDEATVLRLPDSLVERRRIEAPAAGLSGQRIDFVGLQGTITDVLVRIEYLDGRRMATLVHPNRPWIEIPEPEGALAVFSTYVRHGIDHIIGGYDHLLFVLALTLIVRRPRTLVWTITSFTLAHSITLALATLGVVRLPGTTVEATIALSILLFATEIPRVRAGTPSATARWPWVVAFLFGLLHGFGFASALDELGLPEGEIPLALFAFNVGVELGQLAFIFAVLAVLALIRSSRRSAALEGPALTLSTYVIGVLAAYWLLERMIGIFV